MGSQSKRTGKTGEKLALEFLQKKGFTCMVQNYHIRGGEIDLIMEKDGILVFVEVKTRRSKVFGRPEDALTDIKKKKLLRAIYHYLFDYPGHPWRCDLIAIQLQGNQGTITHYHDIFS